MEITEVRVKLIEGSEDRLQAFCSVTFDDCFVVRDLKVIDGGGGPFVAMPSRKLTAHCPQCGYKNHLRAPYCNHCGLRQNPDRAVRDAEGRSKLYADIAHPINSTCREMIQERVLSEFRAERDRSLQPGYIPRYDEDYEDAGPEELPDVGRPLTQRVDQEAHSRPAPHSPLPAAPSPLPRHLLLSANTKVPTIPPRRKPAKSDFGAGIFE